MPPSDVSRAAALSGRTLPEVRQRRSSIFEPRSTVVDAPRLEDRPAVGTVLDARYVVGELLGQGGMGYVLAATHAILGKRLAIKVLRREMTRDPGMADLFREEARTASSLGHPNIVEVSDFGALPATDGVPGASYFVMERIEGRCLADILSEDGSLEVGRAVDIVRQMASALHAAHERGIVHRDVKPENVILTTRGNRLDHVKILDFGLASLGHDDLRVIGTPHYMSPEQGRGRGVDRRSDVYSLGVVLFELVTGELPFDDDDALRLLRLHALERPPSAASLRADLPPAVVHAIDRALSKKPEDRPVSMEAFIELLASIEAPTPTTPIRKSEPALTIGLVASGPQAVDPSRPRAEFSLPRPSNRPADASAVAPAPRAATRWLLPLALALLAACVVIGAFASMQPAASATSPAPSTVPVDVVALGESGLGPVSGPPAPPSPITTPAAERPRAPAHRASPSGGGGPEVAPSAATAPTTNPAAMDRGLYYADQNLLDPWE